MVKFSDIETKWFLGELITLWELFHQLRPLLHSNQLLEVIGGVLKEPKGFETFLTLHFPQQREINTLFVSRHWSMIGRKSIAFGTQKVVKLIETPNYTRIQRKILYLARQNRVLWSRGDCEQNTFFILFELKIKWKALFKLIQIIWSPGYKNRTLPKIINPQRWWRFFQCSSKNLLQFLET